MKVVRLIESFFPVVSGPAMQALHISEGLERRGHNSPIYTSALGLSGEPPNLPVSVSRLPISRRAFKFLVTPDLKRRLGEEKCDIVHAHGYRSYQAEAGFAAARRSGTPFVISTHGTLESFRHFRMGLLRELPYHAYDLATGKRTVKKADVVVVNSAQEQQEAMDFGVPRGRVHRIPVGATAFKKGKKRFPERQGLKLLWAGRISRNRNVHSLIEALAAPECRKATLSIVGFEAKSSDASRGGYIDELKALAARLGLGGRVRFLGSVPPGRMMPVYDTHDAFVYPSYYENFGQTVLDAAAARMPLVCARTGVAAEIVRDGENGLLTGTEPAAIADAIGRLDAGSLSRFSDGIAGAVAEGYSWEEIIETYLRLYGGLLGRRRTA
ncbi:glycosyltransferase family 4 protein [Candidatus Woesearchaeota archaeon]|nr:glycosyltransferase family 4 protein [Candidatus Woesearchaeota archaeon]